MGHSVLPHKVSYRSDLFELENLTTFESINNALLEFEGVLNENNFDRAIGNLLVSDQPNALVVELVLSGTDNSIPISTWIIQQFPTNAHSFSSSFASSLLRRLSFFFLFPLPTLPIPSREEGLTMADKHHSVEHSRAALDILATMTFTDDDTSVFEDDDVAQASMFAKIKPKSQKKSKQAKKAAIKNNVDVKPFDMLGISIPTTQKEFNITISDILTAQKSTLEFYLSALRSPNMANAIKQTFIPVETPQNLQIVTNVQQSALQKQLVDEVPSAYPTVQPMKSALYFDSAEGFGEWQIFISTRADSDLREARRKDRKTFSVIVKKIKELSGGHFSDDNQKRLTGPMTEIPIYEAKMTRDLRLVYQIDCVPEYDSKVERQVLKIFGIYTHAQLGHGRLWDSLGRQLGKKGKEYKHRCTFRKRPQNDGNNMFLPASFPAIIEDDREISNFAPDLPPDDLEQIHSLLVLEKFVAFSQALLHSILANLDVAFPFQVSSHEKAIIEYPYSCYVLGRSGTGKTTTMLFKMLWIERTFKMTSDFTSKPRQVFVTQSRVLAGKVEEYFLKLFDSLNTATCSPQELMNLAKSRIPQKEEDHLVDVDDDINWRSDLPLKFSELRDEHFPLFVTFDRLCKLLEADNEESWSEGKKTLGGVPDLISPTIKAETSRTFVSYDTFLEQYWPHFPQPLTKGLDPSLVFSEIIGIILGSEETITSSGGYLDQNSYANLSQRAQSTFASHRAVIYNIFQSYLKRKHSRNDFDAADRTRNLLQILDKRGVPGSKIDYLYVDEAQDNLLIDALLLRSLCHNADGLFWAGDTAQAISVGSSFRFDELKAFLFRVEKRRQANKAEGYRSQEPPKTFQLAVNYRSHAGIVNCAHSVIELMTKFWPYSIDSMSRETGIVDGLKPVFFNGWNADTAEYEQFLFGASGSHIEFGANQCILVRDEASREKLQEQVGDIGLIMTLYESKGLEFNDVLLYNFFEDSSADLSQWRVVLNAIDLDSMKTTPAPRFDDSKHAGVCNELKFLYVAITRARKNMWIADSSTKGEPMRTFWTTRDLVQNCTPGVDTPRLAVSSTPEEWAGKAKELFERKRYLQAKHCYERADMPRETAIANAYFLREQARKNHSGEPKQSKGTRQVAFVHAAEAFISCAETNVKARNTYFHIAGDCFENAGHFREAALAYLWATQYTLSAKLYRKMGMFDEAVDIVKVHSRKMLPDVVETITDVARLFYFTEHKLQQAHELFSSLEEELEYLEDRDLNIAGARTSVLESMGRLADAAELHLVEGRTVEAIELFLRDQGSEDSMRRANKCILQGLWQDLSFGVSPRDGNKAVAKLLELSNGLNISLLEPKERDEIAMFRAIISGKQFDLCALGEQFLHANNRPAAVLCLDHHFAQPLRIQTMDIYTLVETLRVFLDYVRLLYDLAFIYDPCTTTSIGKLFGFQSRGENDFVIAKGTFLHWELESLQPSPPSIQVSDDNTTISGWDFSHVFRQALADRLRHRVMQENELCHKVYALNPCLTFVIYGSCNRIDCPQEHARIPPSAEIYNARVQAHLQQILILETLHRSQDFHLSRERRHWLGRLYEAMNPPSDMIGTFSNLNRTLLPDNQKAFQVVKLWVHELVYSLDFLPQTPFLTRWMRGATLSFAFDQKEATYATQHSRSMSTYARPGQYLRNGGGYILQDLLRFLEGKEPSSLALGGLALRHIISNRLPVNISVLCDFIESLCGSLVVSSAYQRTGILHDVMLPRSWLHKQLETGVQEARSKTINFTAMIVLPMAGLLEDIYSANAEYLLFGSQRNLATLGFPVRNVFIARICRSLCILGYNIRSVSLRHDIFKAITSLRREDRFFSPLYKRYVYARHWGHLASTVRGSLSESPMDEMVCIFHSSMITKAPYPLQGVRQIVYTTLEELQEGLLHAAFSAVEQRPLPSNNSGFDQWSSSLRSDDLEPDQWPSSIQGDLFAANETNDSELPRPEGAIVDKHEEHEEHEEQGVVDLVFADSSEEPAEIPQAPEPVPPSDDEIRAAAVMQEAYFRILQRRRQPARTGLPAALSRSFELCLKQSQEMEWKNPKYRVRYLGPLPHLLVCLDHAHTATFFRKNETKKRLQNVKHEELDDLSARLTQLIPIFKDVIRLQKALGPTADIHRRCDFDELKRLVTEAVALIRHLPFKTSEDLHADLDMAFKGIVAEKQVSKETKLKPKLCMDYDEYEYL